MCVRVHTASTVTQPWDHLTNTITIPADLDAERAEVALRTVLASLGTDQPCRGAVCWCGVLVTDVQARVPAQRQQSER